ncbi:uncharacterized protein V1518DRAFT_419145 [Limtongia smithiae]|uniref:uncharacterized protein n=1 Tax=Limtongia smithiae TaxID=1125753 RepID=UPI0034CEFC9C
MKTCYYELLEVARTAPADEIRRAYRRQALLLHPDKNIDNIDEATQKFALVQAAYEILSDPDERAWYDSHREQILRDERPGGAASSATSGASYAAAGTTVADLLRFFDPALFSVYNDSDIGFYTIARKVFEQLAEEEASSTNEEEDDDYDDYANATDAASLPSFGKSTALWSEETRYFYGAWSSFSTRKSFAHADTYNLASAPDRRARRAMEKENKKLRDAARKEYNDTVRAFVSFLLKRDPRAKASSQEAEQRKKQAQEKVQAQARLAKERHRERTRAYADQEWAVPMEKDEQFWEEEYGDHKGRKKQAGPTPVAAPEEARDVVDEAEIVETKDDADCGAYAPPQSEYVDNGEENEYDSDDVILYECVVCNKSFKSEKQLFAHEKSKKHIKMVKDVVRKMRKDNVTMGLDEEVTDKMSGLAV